jgi:hypothetical protein
MSKPADVSFAKTRHIRDHCLCLHLQRAARVVARRFDDALSAIDLTQGQFSLRRVSAGWGSENNQVPPANHASPSSLHPKRVRGVVGKHTEHLPKAVGFGGYPWDRFRGTTCGTIDGAMIRAANNDRRVKGRSEALGKDTCIVDEDLRLLRDRHIGGTDKAHQHRDSQDLMADMVKYLR